MSGASWVTWGSLALVATWLKVKTVTASMGTGATGAIDGGHAPMPTSMTPASPASPPSTSTEPASGSPGGVEWSPMSHPAAPASAARRPR